MAKKHKLATRGQLLKALQESTRMLYDLAQDPLQIEDYSDLVNSNQELLAGDGMQIKVDESESLGNLEYDK